MKNAPNQNQVAQMSLMSVKSTAFAFMVFCSLFLVTLPVLAQVTVHGKVTGQAGVPVDGATVSVKGTSTATITDKNGEFSIPASRGDVLIISYVGYAQKQITVGDNTNLNIELSLADKDLGEVVVIGYGVQRKKDVTGSTVSVKGETLNEIKAPNIFNQLQGRAAGVDIVSNSANIGSTGQIRIRGNRSITGNNNPLIVVDGMVYGGSINDINPDYIASLDILKDASATAIYGSRGANGVIIISTKRGSARKPITSYNGYVGMIKPLGTYRLFNGAEYAQFKADAAVGNSNTANSNLYALTPIEKTNLAAGVSTDWQDLLLTTGIRTSHDLSVRGGTDRTQYFFGLGYFRETGIIHDQNLDRYSFSVNVDHKVSERIKVGFTSLNVYSPSNRVGTNAYGSATRLGPLYKPYNDDGTINFQPAIQQGVDFNQINPLTSIGNDDLIKAYQRRYQIQDNFYGEVKILKELKFKVTFGFGWSQTFSSNYTGPNTVFNTNATTAGSNVSENNAEGWQYTLNNSLEYTKNFGDKHRLYVQALQEIQKNHFQQQQFNGQGVPADFIQDYNWQLVNAVNPQAGQFNESALIGYMGRAIYSFNDKYMLTGTLRTDGSSVLAPGHQWITYPAISAGWNLDREKFLGLDNSKVISALKLRAGWGISSNSGINPYTTLGSLTSNFYNMGQGTVFGTNYLNGYIVNTSPNPNLTWEKTKGLNVGVDFGLFNNRISGSLEYYKTRTTDILLNKGLPRSNGTNSILDNVGETESHGVEFSVSSLNIQSKNTGGFTWRTDLNAYFNREKIVALQSNLKQDLGNGWFVGQPITVIYDYKMTGIWQTKDAAQAAVYGVSPGDIKIEDINKDNAITAADRQVLGSFQPDLVAGMTNYFQYKNFDLNIVLFGRFGQNVVVTYLSADGGANGYPFFMNSRVEQLKVDYWTPTNPTNAFPQPDAGRDALQYTSTLTYRDGSFIKIRTIDFGYNFTKKVLGNSGIENLRVYFSAQNPFILWAPLVKDNLGLDPEGNAVGNAINTQGGGATSVPNDRAITVGMGVPPSRAFIFGVNLSF